MYFHGTWTQWSLGRVTLVTATDVGSKVIYGSMTFSSSFSQKVHCIHILWCIFMGLGHNDPWVESHMWPQQMWGQRSSRGQWPLVQVWAKRFTVSTYFDVFSWTWTQWSLGRVTHVTSTDVGSKVIRGQWPLVQVFFCKIGHCIHILWCIFMGLGHNDPWVKSHMWPQQMWGQRASRGQWPLVQVFAKTVTVSTYFHVCSGETRGSRTTCFTSKSPSVTQRSVSQENAYKKS